MLTDGLVYESVVDFAADSPRRGLLNPPRGADGEVVRPRPAPENDAGTVRAVRVARGSAWGDVVRAVCGIPRRPSCRNPSPDGEGGRGSDDDGGVLLRAGGR